MEETTLLLIMIGTCVIILIAIIFVYIILLTKKINLAMKKIENLNNKIKQI